MASMKDSGVEWIGEIPEEWKLGRLGFLASMESGATPSKDNLEYWDGTIPWISSMEVKRDVLLDTSLHISPAAIESCSSRMLPAGTVVMVVRSGILQHTIPVAILGASMAVNQDIKAFQFTNALLPKYFFYFVKGNNDNLLKVLLKDKSTVDNISQVYLKVLRVPVPPKEEQQAIAALLDQKCAAIDATTNTLETQISTLERYRASVIHEAVTRGLDPTAPTKPSNVDWIGNIPQEWECKRVKDVMKINNGREIERDDGPIPVYGSGGAFKWTDKALCLTSSLLFGRKGTVDKPLLVDGLFWTVDTMFYSVPRVLADLRFVYYCAICFDYNYYQTGSTLPSMTQSDLGSILMPFPNHVVQKSIADYLDTRTAAIDAVIATKRKQLDVLKRRRQSLIYEYVTGKRRVGEEG